jgi:hypothetical protein
LSIPRRHGCLPCPTPAAAAPASPLSGRREARPGVLDDRFTLKFIESGRDMEEQPSLGRAGVDIACQHFEGLFQGVDL